MQLLNRFSSPTFKKYKNDLIYLMKESGLVDFYQFIHNII